MLLIGLKRINYKTVSIETKNHGKWRVGYPLILNKNTDLDLKERPENCLITEVHHQKQLNHALIVPYRDF